MSRTDVLTVRMDGRVRRLNLNRPEAKNALSSSLIEALGFAFDAALADDDVAVMVIDGAANCFSAGADVREMSKLDGEGAHQFLAEGGALFRRIERSRKPVIACVDGIAAGGGFELALACSLVVASTSARFGLPEASLGLIPGFGGTQRLTRAIGSHRAARLMLTGALIPAAEAWELGLLSSPPVAPDELNGLVAEMTTAMLAKSMTACAQILSAVEAARSGSFDSGLALEIALGAGSIASRDGREGMAAFAEKRPAVFGTDRGGA